MSRVQYAEGTKCFAPTFFKAIELIDKQKAIQLAETCLWGHGTSTMLKDQIQITTQVRFKVPGSQTQFVCIMTQPGVEFGQIKCL